jgi:pimeloyl-ACP methyl ester carboxylesterase
MVYALGSAGCLSWLPAKVPLPAKANAENTGSATCLVLLLPGAGDGADTFDEKGFVQRLRASGLSLDIVAADTQIGHYTRGIFAERFERDVIGPAQSRGKYKQTWLMGPSMGGFGSLYYAMMHPERIDGVLALAPFLGSGRTYDEVEAEGGLLKWRPPAKQEVTEGNFEEQLWRWLRATLAGEEKSIALHLGWGDKDMGARGPVLARALFPERKYVVPGGHDWGPWNALLERFLQNPEFRAACRRES